MRPNTFIGFATLIAACLLLSPAVHAQVEGCPSSICVGSQTSLVFNPQTGMVDAFTSATTDYTTASWYNLCVNLAVLEVNGPSVVNWTILLPSATPSYCSPGSVENDQSGSVAATPGRQYFAQGLAQLFVYYTYSDEVADCGSYCDGYYYDAEGYSLLSTTPQPSNPNGPSIDYTYPYNITVEPVYSQQIAMNGSGAVAWAPPVIYSVSPNQWTAGVTTAFTIQGAGFGYSPTLAISGIGVTGYTNPCASTPSSSCDTQIVATVTIDASTPAGSVETITVTANGQNPSGFLPVQVTGQSGQATAQATTTQAAVPTIVWTQNGCGGTSIAGTTQTVVVGQKISFTGCIPQTVPQITSVSWSPSLPTGAPNQAVTAVGGYALGYSSPQATPGSAQVVALQAASCSTSQSSCAYPSFYFISQGSSQFRFSYTPTGGTSQDANVTFNVVGPTGVSLTAKPAQDYQVTIRPGSALAAGHAYGTNATAGMSFTASATLAGVPKGQNGGFTWVQLIDKWQSQERTASGAQTCLKNSLVSSQLPVLDNWYPYPSGGTYYTFPFQFDSANDSPQVALASTSALGEKAYSMQFTMYLMWDPALPSGCNPASINNVSLVSAQSQCESIPVPLASLVWTTAADATNTLVQQPQGLPLNGTTWVIMGCSSASANQCVLSVPNKDPNNSYPVWTVVQTNPAPNSPPNSDVTCTPN